MTTTKKTTRTAQGLRDVLFEEIDRMRGPDADPKRAVAIANLSKQIISTAKVELEFHSTLAKISAETGKDVSLGALALGS